MSARAGVRRGEWVTIVGVGGVGLSAVQIAVAAGAKVVAVDRNPAALALARSLGAEHTVLADGHDSGYDDHFREIGQRFGPFDLAILECDQYNKNWKYIHMMPEEVVQAALDLRAKRLLPVHWGKFTLANHDWDEPLLRVTAASEKAGLPIVTPLIGECLDLKNTAPLVSRWVGMQ